VTVTLSEQPARDWPEGLMFWPTRQIAWQTEYIARMYLMGSALLAADMGTGKSVMALGVAGLAFEQGAIDHVLVVSEPNKIADSEWPADFRRFTRIQAGVYWGPRRKKMLDSLPQAIITTYETCRDDIAVFPAKGSKSKSLSPGPLMEALRGKRVLVVYDEITKLGRRTSNLYKAHHWMLTQLRKHAEARVLGLSATPMDTDLENVFSELRLVVPHAMPTVAQFEEKVVKSRDPYGRPRYHEEGREWFRAQCESWILRKRKSDPDVRDSFPPLEESFRRIRMHADQYAIYRLLEDLAWDPKTREHRPVPGLNILLRQLAGDPWAVLEAARSGDSELARVMAEEMGAELERCSSAKAQELASLADLVMSSGGKLLVFTFFGQTVIPALKRRLGDRPVYVYHGGLSAAEREHQKLLFREHQGGAIMLASDAGARGINLPWVSVTVEYEAARTHSLRQQRAGRGHRLGREDPLTFITLVLDSSIEGASSIRSLLARNADQDFILGDEGAEGYVTADDRRELFAQARPRKAG
jgi:superfamily II DNA or RNA helicase